MHQKHIRENLKMANIQFGVAELTCRFSPTRKCTQTKSNSVLDFHQISFRRTRVGYRAADIPWSSCSPILSMPILCASAGMGASISLWGFWSTRGLLGERGDLSSTQGKPQQLLQVNHQYHQHKSKLIHASRSGSGRRLGYGVPWQT